MSEDNAKQHKFPETAQEVFDTVAKHLLAQNEQSKEGTTCLYRGPKGTKCAVGCLIPDEMYDEVFNSLSLESLLCSSRVTRPLRDFLQLYAELLKDLQFIHDSTLPQYWRGQLRDSASELALEWKFEER